MGTGSATGSTRYIIRQLQHFSHIMAVCKPYNGKWNIGPVVGTGMCLTTHKFIYMNYVNIKRIVSSSFILTGLLITTVAHGQKYKTMSDTTRLNKEYGEISLEVAKLNTKLIEEKNKTADYHSKTSSTAGDAVATAQASKDQADVATSGNTTDTK